MISLSEQQLVDCAGDFDNHGCHGGLPSNAFEYISHVGGLMTEEDYPYEAKERQCKFRPTEATAFVHGGAVNLTRGVDSEKKDLLHAVHDIGPVASGF